VQKTVKPQPAVRVTTKPVNLTQPATRNVMKITHDEQIEARLDDELQARLHDEEVDSAPVAPSSVRLVGHEENRIPAQQPAELPATTVATPIKARPTNPLR
jgi:hypothetical protein